MTRQRGGRRYGAAMGVWLFFANLFEPRKVAATEHVDRRRALGPEAEGTRRAAAAPPEG